MGYEDFSLLGFLDGFTALAIILSTITFGLLSFYHARKLEAKLLAIAGLAMIFVGCFWMGPAVDFLFILLTGTNLSPVYLYGILSYMWIAPGVITAFYLGAELMVPEKKKIIVGFYAILGVIFEILLFTSPLDVFVFNEIQSGDLIDSGFNRASPAYWLIIFFLISILIFLAIGFAIKAKQATGELRKKFTYLSLGWFIFFVVGVFDSLMLPGIYLVAWRLVMCTFALWNYLGLKT